MNTSNSLHLPQAACAGGLRSDRGVSLVESLFALLIVVVASGGVASMYVLSARSNGVASVNTQLLSSARSKLEQVQAIPFEQAGIRPVGGPAGPGYMVLDPVAAPFYNAANGDILLSDTATLRDGTAATRTVTITAIDDAADGTGTADADTLVDPNTDTILDYKLVTVTASATLNHVVLTQTLSTIIRGELAVEVMGATQVDSTGDAPIPIGKVKKTKAATAPVAYTDPDGCAATVDGKVKKADKTKTTTTTGC